MNVVFKIFFPDSSWSRGEVTGTVSSFLREPLLLLVEALPYEDPRRAEAAELVSFFDRTISLRASILPDESWSVEASFGRDEDRLAGAMLRAWRAWTPPDRSAAPYVEHSRRLDLQMEATLSAIWSASPLGRAASEAKELAPCAAPAPETSRRRF